MGRPMLFLSSCFYLLTFLTGYQEAEGSSNHHHHRQHHRHGFSPKTLFVFGDSYADTGNNGISVASSWKVPYGSTFPGKPSGRYSDGRVLTDYLARFVGIKTPVAYRWRNYRWNKSKLRYGMNFANGGTGVFDVLYPNMTTQIDFFQRLVYESVYTKVHLLSSLALVSLSGNDYSAYLARGGTAEGLPAFITSVVNQLTLNMKRIHSLGVRKVVVAALQPLGCLPRFTVEFSHQSCNDTVNLAVDYHNSLLKQAVAKLNQENNGSPFLILDLNASFLAVLNNQGHKFGLQPCCVGVSSNYSCGSVDEKGVKMYTVCDKPENAFFWDNVHPTQAGWAAVYSTLQANLQEIHY